MKVKLVEASNAARYLEQAIYNNGINNYDDLASSSRSRIDADNPWGAGDIINFSKITGPTGLLRIKVSYHFVRYGRDILIARFAPPGDDCSSLEVVCNSSSLRGFDVCDFDMGGDNIVFFRQLLDTHGASSFDKIMGELHSLQRFCQKART